MQLPGLNLGRGQTVSYSTSDSQYLETGHSKSLPVSPNSPFMISFASHFMIHAMLDDDIL
jgi:hypothetical protein